MKTIHYNHIIPVGNTQESAKIQLNENQTSAAALGPQRNFKAGFFSTGTIAAATVAVLLGVLPTTASALAFDSSISITGSAELSPIPLTAPTGNASQGGTLTRIMGEVPTTTTFNGTTVSGTNPLTGTLTSTGDGFGIALNASGSSTTATSEIDELFGDYSFVIKNESLLDTFIVNLKLAFDSRVSASGTDAFGNSEISLDNVTGGSEIFFSGLSSDTVIGNRKFVFPDANTNLASGDFGGSLTDIGSLILSFKLAPGATVSVPRFLELHTKTRNENPHGIPSHFPFRCSFCCRCCLAVLCPSEGR